MKNKQLKFNVMKKTQVLLLLSIVLFSFTGANSQNKQKNNPPLFSNFSYQGNDKVYTENPLKSDEFYTPILQGCYPDPAITRKGDDYYMVCSSFAMYRRAEWRRQIDPAQSHFGAVEARQGARGY